MASAEERHFKTAPGGRLEGWDGGKNAGYRLKKSGHSETFLFVGKDSKESSGVR